MKGDRIHKVFFDKECISSDAIINHKSENYMNGKLASGIGEMEPELAPDYYLINMHVIDHRRIIIPENK
uniref:Uncharacterized protein n=1 Tax=Romanomermis culicivorax TaxID=13658 RepID=A0A915IJF4_ROMCU